jgi:hypothetical protein
MELHPPTAKAGPQDPPRNPDDKARPRNATSEESEKTKEKKEKILNNVNQQSNLLDQEQPPMRNIL